MASLIAHASEHGSTKEIAERIAARIASHQLQTECLPIDRVTGISPYKYVIVGSAVHSMRWLPPVEEFIHDQQKTYLAWKASGGERGSEAGEICQKDDAVSQAYLVQWKVRQRKCWTILRLDFLPHWWTFWR
jgi:flavorubredoxin